MEEHSGNRAQPEPERVQEAVYKISDAAFFAENLEELYREIHRIISELMEARNFYIALVNPATGRLEAPYFVDDFDPPPAPGALEGGLTEYVLRTGEPLLVSPEVFSALEASGEIQAVGAPSIDWLGVPLKTPSGIIGVLVVQTYQEGIRYTEEDMQLLIFVSHQVAMAIDRKRGEEELRRSLAINRALLNAIPDLMFRLDRDGRFLGTKQEGVSANRFYRPPEEFIGHPIRDVLPPALAEQAMRHMEKVLQTGQLSSFEYNLELEHQPRFFEARITPCGEDEILIIVRDITERHRLEQQLLQAQKMESIGAMAGGIAHDFNNILGVILGYASFMKTKLSPGHPFHNYVDSIERGAQRAADLTLQLLAFARGGRMDPKPVNVNSIVSETVQMVSRTMPPNIEIRSRQATDLPTVRADTAQIQQVLMNLIMNARDALAGGGVLRIDTLTESLAESGIAAKPDAHSREYVVIVVSDTGIGMDEETLRRIFEPFFTTKDKGKGTGLGLAMVYGVVKNHGGFVKVTSEVGRGATFRVFLPVCGEPEALPELHEEQTHPLGTETLLVVDDEPDIREFIRDIFTEYGYTVFTAANGLEAVEIFKNQAGRIELVILDMVMPKMDGPETFRRLRKIDPTVKALLSSGYSQDGQAQKLMQEGVVGFLQKPYQVDRLLACVREVLGPLRSC